MPGGGRWGGVTNNKTIWKEMCRKSTARKTYIRANVNMFDMKQLDEIMDWARGIYKIILIWQMHIITDSKRSTCKHCLCMAVFDHVFPTYKF